jgi:hypothetical protein
MLLNGTFLTAQLRQEAAVERDCLQMLRVAANILNKQLPIIDSERSSILGFHMVSEA